MDAETNPDTENGYRPSQLSEPMISSTMGSNLAGVRQYNERLILQLIRRAGGMPKADIARATNLSAQTVSVIINRLIKEGLLDFVAMDIKSKPSEYRPLITADPVTERILSSIRIIMESNIDYEFRTTCVKPLVDEQIMEDIAKAINGARLLALQNFNNAQVLTPDFFENKELWSPGPAKSAYELVEMLIKECCKS